MKNKIRIFTTSSCPWCHKTKEYLDANKIKYENIDVTRNRKAADEMIELSGQVGVPVIDINGNIIVGFDKEALDKQLKRLK
ncbi:glutathione S-transferase N-terminal domain-containing protein [Candidatus Woesearchaeota archaeon]|nr:glutathione S-transferase N-terminal domain-containing protein [Candidatus Woesearchaeota archaeon]